MNLLTDPWLPAIRRGMPTSIRVADIADPLVSDLAFTRQDLQIGTLELLIGIVTMACGPLDRDEWAHWEVNPPSVDDLQAALDPYASAFELLGDGPRFMQFPVREKNIKEASPISRILLGAASGNAETKNLDLIAHRDPTMTMSEAEAAAAIYTHQLRLPGVGSGHKASTRGGDHLTVLVDPRATSAAPALWALVWANVPQLPATLKHSGGPLDPTDLEGALPWMRPTAVLEREDLGEAIRHSRRPDIEVFFAGSRRFWLLENADGRIDRFATRTKGFTYLNFDHPLSPSSLNKTRRSYRKPSGTNSRMAAALAGTGIVHNDDAPRELPALERSRTSDRNTAPALMVARQLMDQADVVGFSLVRDVAAPADTAENDILIATQDLIDSLTKGLKKSFAKLEGRTVDVRAGVSFDDTLHRFIHDADQLLESARLTGRTKLDPDFLDAWQRRATAMAVSAFENAFGDAILRAASEKQAEIAKQRKALIAVGQKGYK